MQDHFPAARAISGTASPEITGASPGSRRSRCCRRREGSWRGRKTRDELEKKEERRKKKEERRSKVTVNTLSLEAGLPARDRLDQATLAGLVGVVAAVQLSIAVAHILLAATVVCWLASHLQRRQRLEAPDFFWPLLIYGGLTLLSAGFSLDPRVSFTDSKQLLLLFLVPVVYDVARGPRATLLLTVILTVGAASALI